MIVESGLKYLESGLTQVLSPVRRTITGESVPRELACPGKCAVGMDSVFVKLYCTAVILQLIHVVERRSRFESR